MERSAHREMFEEAWRDYVDAKAQADELCSVAKYHAVKAGLPFPPMANKQEKSFPKYRPVRARIVARSDDRIDAVGVVGSSRDADLSGATQVEAARTVLSESSQPLRTRTIAERMIRRGFETDDIGKLRNSLFTAMTRKPDVFAKNRGRWELKNGIEEG